MKPQKTITQDKTTRPTLLRSKTIIWTNILLQFFSPLLVSFSAGQVAHAAEKPRAYSQQEQQAATLSQQLGQIAASKNSQQAALDASRNLVVQQANGAIDQWLKQFGTARVQLNTNQRFSLEGSQLDLLLPLLDQQHALTFSQLGLRRLDSRTIANVGLGQRVFADNYTIGGNLFFDHDFTYNHSRLGIGSEYWRNNLKLAANGYLGLTDWHDNSALVDYQAKPANGFDLRANAYLASYPQLGGKLSYEQYFGSNVALFAKDKLQQNPYALTVGVNYTPIPLVTIGVDQKQGQSGSHETRLNLGLTYRFGQTLQQQLDASQIAVDRSLAGSRYDLIDRNNDIVLQYRKQQVIQLSLPSHLQGKANETVSLSATINHKYPLKTIEWQSNDAAIQHGVNQQGDQWFITLPAYNSNGNNSYSLTGIAYDINGNASEPVATTIEVLPDNATLVPSADNTSVIAGQPAQIEFTLTNPQKSSDLAGKEITLTFSGDMASSATASVNGTAKDPQQPFTATTDEQGKIHISFTNSLTGKVTVTASYNGTTATQTITTTADTASATIADLKAINDNQIVGQQPITITGTVQDQYGNALNNTTVTFALADQHDGITLSTETATSNASGAVSTQVSAAPTAQAGNYQVQATPQGGHMQTMTVTFKEAPEVNVTLVASPNTAQELIAGNSVDFKFILAASQASMANKSVSLQFSGDIAASAAVTANGNTIDLNSHLISVLTDNNGEINIHFTNSKAGTVNVNASYTGSTATHTINTKADSSTITIANLAAVENGIVADTDPITITGTVQDQYGNVIADTTVNFAITGDNSADARLSASSTTSTTDGKIIVDVSSEKAGNYQINATPTGGTTQPITVTFIANPEDTASLVVSPNTEQELIAGNNVDFKFTLAASQASMAGKEVSLTFSGDIAASTAVTANGNQLDLSQQPLSVATDDNGDININFTNSKAGTVNIKAEYTGGSTATTATHTITTTPDTEQARIVDLVANPTSATADASSAITITGKVQDPFGNAIADTDVSFKEKNNNTDVIFSSDTAQSEENGTVTTTVTSTQSGNYTIQAIIEDEDPAQAATVEVVFTDDESNTTLTALSSEASMVAGDDNSDIGFTLKNNNNPVINQPVTLTFTGDMAASGATVDGKPIANGGTVSKKTDSHGEIKVKFHNTLAGDVQITASYGNGKNKKSAQQKITTNPDKNSAAVDELTVSTDKQIAASGADIITGTVKDKYGNNVPGVKVTLSTDPADNKSVKVTQTATSDAQGKILTPVNSEQEGAFTIHASTGKGKEQKIQVHFTANPKKSPKSITLSTTTNGVAADGQTPDILQATVTNQAGEPLAGIDVDFSLVGANEGVSLAAFSVKTDQKGHAEAKITSTKEIDNVQVKATVRNIPSVTKTTENAAKLKFVEDIEHETLAIDAEDNIAGKEVSVTFTLKNRNNGVAGKKIAYDLAGDIASKGVSINGTLVAKSAKQEVTTGEDGKVTIKLINEKSGTTNINATHSTVKSATTSITIDPDDESAKVESVTATNVKVKYSKKKTPKISLTALVHDQYGNNASNSIHVSYSVQDAKNKRETHDVTLSAPVAGIIDNGQARTDMTSNLTTEITEDIKFVVNAKADSNAQDPGKSIEITYQK